MKNKNTVISTLLIICLALGASSCAIKDMLLPPPSPTVLEEQEGEKKSDTPW